MRSNRLLTFGSLSAFLLLAPTHPVLGIDLFEHQPVIIESTNGVVTADLVARYANPVVNGRVLNVRTFNGAIPGPTFVASPGETLRIRLINRLPANSPVTAASTTSGGHGVSGGHAAAASDPGHGGDAGHGASGVNTINLHTHGLNVSPEGNQDNVLLNLQPGEYLQYEIKIPADHPSGTFWYHPHRHGSTTPQVASGMAGNILIRGGLDTLPEIAAATHLQLSFCEMPLYTNGPAMEVPDNAFPDAFITPIKIFTINGIAAAEQGPDGQTKRAADFPRINIRPGEVQRWRMTHAGFVDFLTLNLEGHQLNVVAYDAITLPAMVATNQVMIAPGNRADVLVVGGAPGTYLLKSLGNDEQFGNVTRVLAEVVVSGDPVVMALPKQLNPPVSRLPDIADSEIVRRRNITFDITGIDPGETLKFTINNKTFDINRVDETMLLNTAEEWTLSTDVLDTHPFHIHVNWFQVTKINGVPLNPPRWQDTVVIPKGGNVTIRHRFQRYPGKFVMHCHILPHEDFGMMNLVEVIDPQNLTPLQAWRNNRFNSPNDQGEGADSADPDQDGRANLIHYAFGNGPNSKGGLPVATRASVAGTDYFAISATRRKGPDSGVVYLFEKSANLVDWQPLNYAALQVGTPVDLGGGLEKAVVRSDTPLTGAGADPLGFYRLRVVRYQTTGSPIPAGFR